MTLFPSSGCRNPKDPRDSSVGRAVDCSCMYNMYQISIGHWFDSGSRDFFFRRADNLIKHHRIIMRSSIIKVLREGRGYSIGSFSPEEGTIKILKKIIIIIDNNNDFYIILHLKVTTLHFS